VKEALATRRSYRLSLDRARVQVSILLALTVGLYLLVVLLSVRHYGGNISALIEVGQNSSVSRLNDLGHGIVVLRNSTGYDGQTYYAIAAAPFAAAPQYREAFRYQRIGYPAVVWAMSLGERRWQPLVMILVNLIATAAIAYFSLLLLWRYAGKPSMWWALACAASPALLASVQLDLAEPLMTALCLAGLLLCSRERRPWAAVAFAAALLTREVAILFLLPAIGAEALKRNIKGTAVLLAAIVPYLAWEARLASLFGQTGTGEAKANFGTPLAGINSVVRQMRGESIRSAIVHQGSILGVVLFMVVAIAVAAFALRRHYDVLNGALLFHAFASLFAGASIWEAYASAVRVFGGVFPLSIVIYARDRRWWVGVLAYGSVALTLFTFFRLIVVTPALPYYVTP
jgi:hypothetical protein